jgi:hypothetical protein
VNPEDIRIDIATIHYGMKEQDPVQNIRFYNKYGMPPVALRHLFWAAVLQRRFTNASIAPLSTDKNSKFYLKDIEASHLVPRSFCESVLRVYAVDSEKSQAIQEAFRKTLDPILKGCGSHVSPSKIHDIPPGIVLTPSKTKRRCVEVYVSAFSPDCIVLRCNAY